MDNSKEQGEASKPYKRISFAVLGRHGLELKLGPNKKAGIIADKVDPNPAFPNQPIPCETFEYSTKGTYLCVVDGKGATVYDSDSGTTVSRIERPNVNCVKFSPQDSYILTWERYAGNNVPNVCLWDVKDAKLVMSFVEKNFSNSRWPLLQFSDDELVAAYMVQNGIRIYKNKDFTSYDVLRTEGCTQFSLAKLDGEISESNPACFAVFKPENKGSEAKLFLFKFPSQSDKPEAMRSFYGAQECVFKWSPLVNAVLCKTENDIDNTGASYYGKSALYLMYSHSDTTLQISPEKDSNFQDMSWSPNGKTFVAISGRSPTVSALYNISGEITYNFGVSHRNTVRWNSHGRFLMLGGFGNLNGDMDFWDINKKAKMGAARANIATSAEFSPCGRYFFTTCLFPRMRVDNGLTIYTYRGDQVCVCPIEECSKVLWRPEAKGFYPNRPQTPLKSLRKAALKAGVPSPQDPKEQSSVPKYRPPGLTGVVGLSNNSSSDLSSAEVYRPPLSLRVPGAVPGMVPGAAPLKPTQQRTRRRKKKAN